MTGIQEEEEYGGYTKCSQCRNPKRSSEEIFREEVLSEEILSDMDIDIASAA